MNWGRFAELKVRFSEEWEDKKNGWGEEPRHRVMAGPADILPALTRLSLVGLLLSRAPLRFTGYWAVYGR